MFTRDKCIEEERTDEIIIITIKFQRSSNCVERSRTILNLEQALEQVDAIIKCLGEGGTREIYVENLVLEGSRYRNIRKTPSSNGTSCSIFHGTWREKSGRRSGLLSVFIRLENAPTLTVRDNG